MALTPKQQEAILHPEGPAMVVAGPGSGKTLVIVRRAARLAAEAGISPSQILVVTFTRAAAEEMRSRYAELTGSGASAVTFGTFHAVFYRILRISLRLPAAAVVTPRQQREWLREFLSRRPKGSCDEPEILSGILREISTVKCRALPIGSYRAANCDSALFGELYREYDERLRETRKVDFEDMSALCLKLFREQPEVLRCWRRRWRWFLVDEFQDIDPQQYAVLRLLAAPENNLFIVGDEDQSIYRFRGAAPDVMLRFPEDYRSAKRVLLDVCHRCSPQILSAAQRLISHNRRRFPKTLRSAAPDGPPPHIEIFEDAKTERDRMLHEIRRLHAAGTAWKQTAVLLRTNSGMQGLAAAFRKAGIPCSAPAELSVPSGHWAAADILAYLAMGEGSRRRADFFRIMNKPKRYLSRCAAEDPVDAAELSAYYADRPGMQDILSRFFLDLHRIGRMRPFAAIEYIRKEIGYDDWLEEYAGERGVSADALLEILDALEEESADCPDSRAFRQKIAREAEEERRRQQTKAAAEENERRDAVHLATMHASKGREYDAVFLPDLADGVLPHQRMHTAAELEEERRLFYVAMTRARKYVWLSCARRKHGRPQEISRFLKELT